jgi:DNA-3-methyladenine glycosylase I
MASFEVKAVTENDKEWITSFLEKHWGSYDIVSRGKVTKANEIPAFIAYFNNERVGLITYTLKQQECEIISLDSTTEGEGVGTGLLQAVIDTAKERGIKRVWLITTNDNLKALRFYQKRGFELVTIHRHALDISRKLKPQIPLVGADGIPLKDEIELELVR